MKWLTISDIKKQLRVDFDDEDDLDDDLDGYREE